MKWCRLFVLFLCCAASDAWAVIGRPFTPLSYAGVARRTTRRAVYRGAYYSGGYSGAYYGGMAAISTLPAGCIYGAPYYACGGVYYRPYYDGPDLVYVPVDDDDDD